MHRVCMVEVISNGVLRYMFFQICVQPRHVNSLISAVMGVPRPQKSTKVVSQGFLFPLASAPHRPTVGHLSDHHCSQPIP